MRFAPRLPSASDLKRPSVLALLAANLVPLAGVLLLGWDLGEVMLLFWAENIVLGLWHVVKLASVVRPMEAPLVPFFVAHYGMFTGVHGVFVFALFVERAPGGAFALALAALVVSHGVSFVQNFLRGGERERARAEEGGARRLMMSAYPRVVVLHVALIGTGFLMAALGSPVWGLALLVVLKTGVDLGAHLAQRAEGA